MSSSIDVLCLANSEKHGERCIAGVRLDTGGWIRPVSSSDGEALIKEQYETKSGHILAPLDTIRIRPSQQRPKYNQPENWIIGDERWELVSTDLGRTQLLAINTALQREGEIMSDTEGWISRQTLQQNQLFQSLTLVKPNQTEFYIRQKDSGGQPRAKFDFDGSTYDLPITDPGWRRRVNSGDTESLPTADVIGADEEILFTISLGEAHEGRCYKIVAAIFTVASEHLVEV